MAYSSILRSIGPLVARRHGRPFGMITRMPSDALKFAFSNEREPHRDRTKQLLASHPELREKIGKNPYTFLHHPGW